jgi:hypothetical protein
MAETFPIERYLVPATEPPASGTTSETRPLDKGLPETVQLDADFSLAVVLPTGLATQWRDADPTAVVSASEPEYAAWTPAPATPVGDAARPPLAALVLLQGAPVASIPLTAGARRVVPDSGATGAGGLLELRIVSWHVSAGNLQGPGGFGSSLKLDWRRADRAANSFQSPPVDPHVLERLPRQFRLESSLPAGRTGSRA